MNKWKYQMGSEIKAFPKMPPLGQPIPPFMGIDHQALMNAHPLTHQAPGVEQSTGTSRLGNEWGQPNYGYIAGSQAVQGIMAYLRGKKQDRDFRDYDRTQQNPLLQIPANPNTTDQSLYGSALLKKGGPSPSKAAEMLRDGTANKKKLTSKQKKYFQCVAHGGCKKQYGGEIDAEIERDIFADPVEQKVEEVQQTENTVIQDNYEPIQHNPSAARLALEAEGYDLPDISPTGSEPMSTDDFKNSIARSEGAGYFSKTQIKDENGRPASSAFGRYQFIKDTRQAVREKFFPDMGKEQFEEQYKTSPSFQEQVMDKYSSYLLNKYKDPKTAATAFFLGEGRAKKVNDKSYRPTLRNLSVGEYLKRGNFAKGGSVYDLLQSKGIDGSYQSRKELFGNLFKEGYKGTAEQNNRLYDMIQGKEVILPSKGKMDPNYGMTGTANARTIDPNYGMHPTAPYIPADFTKPSQPTVRTQPVANRKGILPYAPNTGDASDIPITDFSGLAKQTRIKDSSRIESGVVVDKGTNVAHIIKDYKVQRSFPVITGSNPNRNESPENWSAFVNRPDLKSTPVGYYKMKETPSAVDYNGNAFAIDPITHPTQKAPIATQLAIHETYDKKNRDPLYDTGNPADRWASFGCVNCKKPDIQEIMNTFPQGDTLRVIDSRKGMPVFQGGGPVAYNPNLATKDKAFQKWYNSNTLEGKRAVPYSDNLDYDYYSFFRNKGVGNIEDHFPDTYKRPNHPTFSNESIYSTPENPGGHWEGEKYVPMKKSGGWIKDAVNPKHKGYCTPMTKKTCTPRRKALARTFKKMAKKRKHEDGGWVEEYKQGGQYMLTEDQIVELRDQGYQLDY